jgi:hypothetical protein
VPNSACVLGLASIRSKFCSSGATGASAPANKAMLTIASAKAAPTTTTVLRATRRRLFVAILREQEPRRERRRVSRQRPAPARASAATIAHDLSCLYPIRNP